MNLQDLLYIAQPMPRSYTTEPLSQWAKKHDKLTIGPEKPTIFRASTPKDRNKRIKELIGKGLGDGSIAVRLNNEGIECHRADVHFVRTGTHPPDGQGSFEEVSLRG